MLDGVGVHSLGLFITSGLLLNLTPGADTVYVVARTVAGGRAIGILSAIGISCGSAIHCLLVAFGLSSVLIAEPRVFQLFQVAGVIWLGFVAVQMWRTAGAPAGQQLQSTEADAPRVFFQAVLTNLLNPKVGLFFLALMPQFVVNTHASRPEPYLFLGAVFLVTGTVISVGQAVLAAHLSHTLRAPRRWRLTQRGSALWLGGLALWVAWQMVSS